MTSSKTSASGAARSSSTTKHNAVTGFNRLGVGRLEVNRFQFTARVAQSLFSDREVVFLDHDSANNPGYVRRFHDELVAIDEGLYLATSHYREGERLRYLTKAPGCETGAFATLWNSV